MEKESKEAIKEVATGLAETAATMWWAMAKKFWWLILLNILLGGAIIGGIGYFIWSLVHKG